MQFQTDPHVVRVPFGTARCPLPFPYTFMDYIKAIFSKGKCIIPIDSSVDSEAPQAEKQK